ncbi:MAG: flavodoxin domain-containing protein [Treponemataceae bacterium]|nr:flavodoxin domain-containing protein [Treponemataceae bacterium]
MKTLVIFTSKTGFTRQYAQWIAEGCNCQAMELNEAAKKPDTFFAQFDQIAFGGWIMAGNVAKIRWFWEKAKKLDCKKLAVFCVGASPAESPDIPVFLETVVPMEFRNRTKAFYCQGGISYEKMNFPMKMMMKAFSSALKNNKNASEKEREMAKWLSSSYDISAPEHAQPVIDWLNS